MKLWFRLLPRSLPAFARRRILARLFTATAQAFAVPAPALGGLSVDERLRVYAAFTREQAGRALQAGQDGQAVKGRLYRSAYPLGAGLRRGLGIRSMDEVMALGRVIYRAIGVEMRGDARGELLVSRCMYSELYSGAVCDLISALDAGLFAGLSGGARLEFSERLSEGCPACRARLAYPAQEQDR